MIAATRKNGTRETLKRIIPDRADKLLLPCGYSWFELD
jgi:hypothetical protein